MQEYISYQLFFLQNNGLVNIGCYFKFLSSVLNLVQWNKQKFYSEDKLTNKNELIWESTMGTTTPCELKEESKYCDYKMRKIILNKSMHK